MKKQLKEDLIALAEKIATFKYREQFEPEELSQLKDHAQKLYEKLTVLHFVEENLFTSGPVEKEENTNEKEEVPKFVPTEPEDEHDDYAPDGTQYNDTESITEPNTEKIKDIVAQMPHETQRVDAIMENLRHSQARYSKNDMEDIGGVHYDHLPQFEPAGHKEKGHEKPKSLNDRLKNTIQIGVNERQAYVKHLFEGSNSDYNRVLSQLNTIKSRDEAIDFVLNMVKPDYNNWKGKEEYEIRFLARVENKFE